MLADAIVEEVEKKGGKPFLCGTPVVSDAETMVSIFILYKVHTYVYSSSKC